MFATLFQLKCSANFVLTNTSMPIISKFNCTSTSEIQEFFILQWLVLWFPLKSLNFLLFRKHENVQYME